jgi:hypothetical protein
MLRCVYHSKQHGRTGIILGCHDSDLGLTLTSCFAQTLCVEFHSIGLTNSTPIILKEHTVTHAKQCVIFAHFSTDSLTQSENIADALNVIGIANSSPHIYWFDTISSFTKSHLDVKWHDLPLLEDGTATANPRVRVNGCHPRQKFKPTSTHAADVSMPDIQWETAEILVAKGLSYDLGALCYKLHGFFSTIGKTPNGVKIIRTREGGYDSIPLLWDEICDAAKDQQLTRRFRNIYSFNFRCIAGGTIKKCVENQPIGVQGMALHEDRMRTASMGGFRPEFLQVLYQIDTSRPSSYDFSSLNPEFVHVIRHLLQEDENWTKSFTDASSHHYRPSSARGVEFVFWKGSGKYTPLSGSYGDFLSSGTFQAVCHALKLGFITATPECGVVLTSSGSTFLGLVSRKLEDVDAPIRWRSINDDNLLQSDDWLRKHFRHLKRNMSTTDAG